MKVSKEFHEFSTLYVKIQHCIEMMNSESELNKSIDSLVELICTAKESLRSLEKDTNFDN